MDGTRQKTVAGGTPSFRRWLGSVPAPWKSPDRAHGLPIASGRSFRGGFAPMERGAGTSGMRGGILLVRCLKHLAPVRPIVDRRIVFGTGTVVSRMAHHYKRPPRRLRGLRALPWGWALGARP